MGEFGETTYPCGRKDHRCEWCGETIPTSEKHAHFVGMWDGEFQDWRMHSECYSECYEDASENDVFSDGFMPYEHERPSAPATGIASKPVASRTRANASSIHLDR